MTQREKTIEKLLGDGVVDNFWAIKNYILRLGAIICDLSKDGWEFSREYGEESNRKNYFYTVTKYGNRFIGKAEERIVSSNPQTIQRETRQEQRGREDNARTTQLDFRLVSRQSPTPYERFVGFSS